MELVEGPEEGQLLARVRGELDAAGNPLLQQTLLGALRRAGRLLTLDLSEVTYFGSAGVTALVWLSHHPEAAGKHVRVVASSRIVTGPLELTGLLPGVLPPPGIPRALAGDGSDPSARTPVLRSGTSSATMVSGGAAGRREGP